MSIDISNGLCFPQASLQPLHTPGIQAFLHLLPTVCGLWMLVEVGPLTKETVLGVAPTAALSALKVTVSTPQTNSFVECLASAHLSVLLSCADAMYIWSASVHRCAPCAGLDHMGPSCAQGRTSARPGEFSYVSFDSFDETWPPLQASTERLRSHLLHIR